MRMWEIREKDRDRGYRSKMGMRDDKSLEEAYECGYEDGWADAMKEIEEKDSEHGYRRSMRMR